MPIISIFHTIIDIGLSCKSSSGDPLFLLFIMVAFYMIYYSIEQFYVYKNVMCIDTVHFLLVFSNFRQKTVIYQNSLHLILQNAFFLTWTNLSDIRLIRLYQNKKDLKLYF